MRNVPKSSLDAAFESQLLNELDALYRTARYLVSDPQLAEDIVQDVVARAIESRSSFQPNRSLRPWLFAILRHRVADHFRQIRKQPVTLDLESLGTSADSFVTVRSDEALLDQMMDERIEQALAQLPEEMRLAVLLADVEDFTYKEIAETLGWPLGSVMSRLHRGRKKLRQLLQTPETSHAPV